MAPHSIPARKTTASYGPHPRQTLDVYQQSPSPDALWIIFVHGGAWRDPLATSSAGTTLLSYLLHWYPSVNAASITYRLSKHPDKETEYESTQHPGHLEDVKNGVWWLMREKAVRRYVLVGHSAGAWLAFMSVRPTPDSRRSSAATTETEDKGKQREGECASQDEDTPLNPLAVMGVEGIYNLKSLVEEHPEYIEFIEGAFGPDKPGIEFIGGVPVTPISGPLNRLPPNPPSDILPPPALDLGAAPPVTKKKPKRQNTDDPYAISVHKELSPAVTGVKPWNGLAVLAMSDEDELVGWRQTEEMKEKLEEEAVGVRVVKVHGGHDEVLEDLGTALVLSRYLETWV